MLENINIDGSTVSAELHGDMYNAFFGKSRVFNYGSKLEHQIVSNNLIRIKDGVVVNQGRVARIPYGSSVECTIENGETGVNRKDLIVLRFENDGMKERQFIKVIKGQAGGVAPTPETGNIYQGDMVNEMPLYLVTLEGLSITSVEKRFDIDENSTEIIKISPTDWDTTNMKYRYSSSKITSDIIIDITPVTAEYYVDEKGWTSTEFKTMIEQISNARLYCLRHNNGYIDLGYLGDVPTVNVYLTLIYRGV